MNNLKKQIIANKISIIHSYGVTIGMNKISMIMDEASSKAKIEENKELETKVLELKQEILNLIEGYELLLSDKVADIYVKQSN